MFHFHDIFINYSDIMNKTSDIMNQYNLQPLQTSHTSRRFLKALICSVVTNEINQYLLIKFTAGEIKWLKRVSHSEDLVVFPVSQYSSSGGIWRGMRFRFSVSIKASSHSSICVICWAQRLQLPVSCKFYGAEQQGDSLPLRLLNSTCWVRE